MLSTIFHNSWQSGRVNLIVSPDIADGMNGMLKQSHLCMWPLALATLSFGGA